jgi:hypothetical protein
MQNINTGGATSPLPIRLHGVVLNELSMRTTYLHTHVYFMHTTLFLSYTFTNQHYTSLAYFLYVWEIYHESTSPFPMITLVDPEK